MKTDKATKENGNLPIFSVVCSCVRCGNTWMQTPEYFKMKNITKATYINCAKCHKIGEEFMYIPYCD